MAAQTIPGPGAGRLDFEKVRGRTVLRTALATSPLRFLTPRNQGNAAWIYTTTLGGGFVNGDKISLELSVGTGAEALLLTQASTKIYRGDSAFSLHAQVRRGGMLVSIPDPTVCFKGATFAQSQEVDLEEDASLLLMDTIHSGRHGSGERWEFGRLASRIHVRQSGRHAFFESLSLDPLNGSLLERMGRFNALAVIVLLGPEWREPGEAIRSRLASEPLSRGDSVLKTATALGEGGTLIRLASASTEGLSHVARELLAFLPPRLGDNPWARKG
jgi:urease accessory protein